MRASSTLLMACAVAACAGPRSLPRAAVVPPLDLAAPEVFVEPRARADADRSPPLPAGGFDDFGPSDRGDPSPGLRDRVIIQTVEVEVPAPRASFAPAGDLDYGYYVASPRYGVGGARPRSRFPINTAIGAGVGAVIGHQRGRRDRGALIGGGVGLMLDLMRGWR